MTAEPRGAVLHDDFYDDDDDDDEEPSWEDLDPSEFADPGCVECGGQGGWCREFDQDGQCIWQECECVEYPDE